MALTDFQRTVCRLLADHRKREGVSYIAGALALNLLLELPRVSRDIDIFHDAEEAVHSSFDTDRQHLQANGFSITMLRELPGFVQVVVSKAGDEIRMEWTRDSAFRFFPLVEHEDLGLTMHPFDLATNKVLALVGRLEVRDWVDVINSHAKLQPLGYLMWAACGKDPGFSPGSLLAHARRTGRYSALEVAQLQFEGDPPDAAALASDWHAMLTQAGEIIDTLPAEQSGNCVLDDRRNLFAGNRTRLEHALDAAALRFHAGTLGGALPQVVE